MTQPQLILLLGALLFSAASPALSPDAEAGRLLYPACQVCHNPQLQTPLGPPMWGVQRRYKQGSLDKEDFIQSMVEFVKTPTLESAIHDEAVAQLGVMPAMPLPDSMLQQIASYIYEESFPPPCAHWESAVKHAAAAGDATRAQKDQRQLERYCR